MNELNRKPGFLADSIVAATILCLALTSLSAFAADPNLQNCVEQVHPVSLSQLGTGVVGSVQDVGNLTVMELSGDYDKGLTSPRQQVAAGFYAAHPDQYDFLVVFTTFEFPTDIAQAFYNPIRNDTTGTGQLIFDNTAAFGSTSGKLQGYVDMAAMSRYDFVPGSSGYEFALGTLAHELMHRWAAYVHFIDAHGSESTDLIGQQSAHWNYFLDTDASLMYGADWQLQGDNEFHSIDIRHRYSPLDLYLAGFAAPSEVPPFTIIRNGDGAAATAFPVLGAVSGGQGEAITIDQVIAASGARTPSAANAPKSFTAAMILLKRPGENVSADQLLELERYRVRFQQQFVQMTGGRGIVRMYTQALAGGTALPAILHGSGTTDAPSGVAGAIQWLESRQKSDGHWEDRPATAMRDTVAVVQLLSELDTNYSGISTARTWMASHGVVSIDQRAWKLLGANLAYDSAALVAAQDANGGFAIEPGWNASALDTAIVANALANQDAASPALATALQLVGSQQNVDGSFGIASGGRGRALPTLRAATLLASSGNSNYLAARQRASDWLSTQQSPDGGIGNIDQASLPDTIEMYSLLGRIQPAAQIVTGTRTFVRQSQQISGDWGGSVYLTATAALAYAHDQRGNLTISGMPTANPSLPHDGEQVTLTAVVANTGSIPVPATVARWYDGDPDSGGVQIGADVAVPSLASGSSATTRQIWDTSGRVADHILWLVVDADNAINESSEQDNRSSIAMTVSPPSDLPDLVLNSADFALNPSAIASLPGVVHLSGALRNLGAAGVSAVVVKLYAQPDVTHALASTTVDVTGRSSTPLDMDFNVTTAATLNLLVRADPDNAIAEASETNNDASIVLPFGQSLDLEVTPIDIAQLEAIPRVGQNIDFDVALHNRGTVDSPPATFHAEVVQGSATTTIFDAPVQIGAGQSQTRRVTWRTGQPGAARLRVVLDPGNQVAETSEDNNSAQLDFTVSALDQADLTFVSDSLAFIPTPGLQGQPLIASLGVRNLSSVATGSFRVALYAADPRTGAAALGSTTVASLDSSSDTTVTINIADLGLAGDQILYAFIDADNQIAEIDETNNVIIAPLHVVPLPDIAISVADIALNPALPVPGQPVQGQVTVRNLGGQDAHGVIVRLREGGIAADGVNVPSDQTIATLAAGGSMVLTWNWTLGLYQDSRMVTAIADPDDTVREGSEDNNQANLPFDVQNGNFFANQRYISPNGDGVQDETAIVFVTPVAGAAEVDIVNGAQYTVRHFTNVQMSDALRGQVIWDGRDDRGRIVPDGDYRVSAIDANHQNHSGPLVTVDNNLSSVLEAVDTRYGIYGALPSDNRATQIPQPSSPFRDQLFYLSDGLYRTDTVFPSAVPLISAQWLHYFAQSKLAAQASVSEFAICPDGRTLVATVDVSGNTDSTVLLKTAADQFDTPQVLATFGRLGSPRVLGFLDANTIVVGPTDDGTLKLVDAGTGSVTLFRDSPDVGVGQPYTTKVLTTGVLFLHMDDSEDGTQHVWNPWLFVPRNVEHPVLELHSLPRDDADRRPGYRVLVSPQETALAVYERNRQEEKIDLINLTSGERVNLLDNPSSVAIGSATGQQDSVGRYGLGWLERQDELMVQNAVSRELIAFSESGSRLTDTVFPALQRLGNYTLRSNSLTSNSDSSTVFSSVPGDLIGDDCHELLAHSSLGIERHIYDPTIDKYFVRFGESISYEYRGEGTYLDFLDGIRDFYVADVGSATASVFQQGTLTPLVESPDVGLHPTLTRCAETPSPEWPILMMGDGARIRADGHVQTLSRGVSPKVWADGDRVGAIWPDETRVLLDPDYNSGYGRVFASLLDQSTILRARTLGRGIELSGIAADRNFANYKLDWAPIDQQNNWRVLTPASSEQVFLDEFLTWVPPQAGTFVIRLTAVDKAGNSSTATATASSFYESPIDSFAAAPRFFSPNGDSIQDKLNVKYRVIRPATIALRIFDASGNLVRSTDMSYGTVDLGPHEFDWDGRNDNGQLVPDGRYRLTLDAFGVWASVDTASPELVGTLTQAKQVVLPFIRFATRDTNPGVVVLESTPIGADSWSTLTSLPDQGLYPASDIANRDNWTKFGIWPDDFRGHSFRLRATDLAGNTRIVPLGDAEDVLVLQTIFQGTKVGGFAGDENWEPDSLANVPYSPPPFTTPDTTKPPILLDELVSNDNLATTLAAWDMSGTLAHIFVEVADSGTPTQWFEDGSNPLADVTCPENLHCRGFAKTLGATGAHGKLEIPFDIHALPPGSRALVRLRGERADGTTLYSNQGYIGIGGIDPPKIDSASHEACVASSREYFEGPLSSAVLHYLAGTREATIPASDIEDDSAYFRISTPAKDATGWVVGIDSKGRVHRSADAPMGCSLLGDGGGGGGGSGDDSAWVTSIGPGIVARDQCDGQPSDQIALQFSIAHWSPRDPPAEPLPSHVRLSYVDGILNQRVVLLDRDVDASNALTVGQAVRFSTALWPEGGYEGRMDLTYPDGSTKSKTTILPVAKNPPQIQIVAPRDGLRVCALPDHSLNVEGSVVSPGESAYRLEIGIGAKPTVFACKLAVGESIPNECDTYDKLDAITANSHSGLLGNITDVQDYNGISTVRLKALNWSGGTVCTTSSIQLVSDVEFGERMRPQAPMPGAAAGIVGISPTGEPRYAQGQFFLLAGEPVQFTATVHPASIVDGQLTIDDTVLATLSQDDRFPGDVDFAWDGRIDGNTVPDGLYGIVAAATDGCSFAKSILYGAIVDKSPPSVMLAAPEPNTSTSAAVIEISGSVTDNTLLASWSIDYAISASPNNWQNLASGSAPVAPARVLRAWSRGSLTGAVDIRLSAVDALGNRSETHLPLTLLDPAKLIASAELLPLLFSPNADGALDTTRLKLGLLQKADLSIKANNAPLYSDTVPAGSTGFVWDGKDGAGHTLADGTYPVVVDATDPNGLASPESVALTATIDNTPPSVTILQPAGAFAAGDSSVRIHVEDAHFASYDATLTRTADKVVVASASGTQGGDVMLTALQGFQEGAYALHVVARDGAGNVTTRDASFQLDANKPVVTLTNPDDRALIPSATLTSVKGSVNDANLASWTLSVAPETVDTWTDLAQGAANIDPAQILAWTPNLPDGRYRLRLRGVDQAGNTTDVVHVVEVDGTPPVAHITVPANGSVVKGSFEIDGTASDAHFASYRISVIAVSQLASGQWADVFVGTAPVDNAKLAALTLNLAEDNYMLRLLVTDKVGLTASDQVNVRIDTQPPPVPLNLIGHVDNHRDSVLDWSPVGASDLAGYYVYRGGAKITPAPIAAIHYVDQNAPEGHIPYYVTAIDQAGNESAASNSITLLIDHTPPTVAITRPAPVERVRGVYDIIGTAYSHDDFKQYRLTAQPLSPAGTSTTLASSTLPAQGQKLALWDTLAIADETTVRVRLEAEDVSGNIGAIDVDVVVDNGPPAKPTGLTAVLAGADVQAHWNPNTESDLLGYLLYRDNVLVNATGTFLPADLRPFALADNQYPDKAVPDGTHTYVVYAIDRAGNVSAPSDPATLDPIDGHPPSMVIEQPANGTRFETSVTVLATSPDSDVAQVQFAWRAQGTGSWTDFGAPLMSAPYRIVWTPPQGTPYGNYQIRALARDLGGRVDPAPPAVSVIYADLTPPDKPTNVAAHADAATVHVTWNASTAADLAGYNVYRGYYQVNSGLVTATTLDDPDLYDGDYTYTVTAVDNYSNESDPSASATAHVFSIALDQPYSPLSAATVDIGGSSARAGTIGVHVDTDSGSTDSAASATSSSGAIAISAQALALGSNHVTARVTDSNGDLSRPADVWLDRGNVPAAPTGVTANVADHTVDVGWNANSESDLLGYRVFRNGHAAVVDTPLGETPTAIGPGGYDPGAAVDSDPLTAWAVSGFYGDPDASPDDPFLEVDWTQARTVTVANVTWSMADMATGNLDVYGWSGHAWIRVARVRGAASVKQSIIFEHPYRTTRLKLVLHGSSADGSYEYFELAELQLLELPVQSGTALAETVIDGTYHYQVSALSNFAFESPLSAEAVADVGHAGDTAVVLSGSLTGNDASLSWTASASPAVMRYDLQRDGQVINSIAATDPRSYVDHGLGNGAHLYVVYAYDAVGNSSPPSNTVSLTVSGVGPGVPIGLTVTAPATGAELDENWQAGPGTTPDHYILRRSTSPSGPFEEVDEPSDAEYFDGDVTNGTTYWYTVETIDADGLASGQCAPVSGTPTDHIPPAAPVLTYPTVAGVPLAQHAITSIVCGSAEYGAAIELTRDGVAITDPDTIAFGGDYSISFHIYNSDHFLPAPDGEHVASVDNNGAISVLGIHDLVSAYRLDDSSRLQSWAAHGMTLYYVAGGADDLFRWELGQQPQAIAHPITQVSAVAVSADERTLAIAGSYLPDAGAAIDGVWLISRSGGAPRRIGTLDPVTLDASHPLLWSPDGSHLLAVGSDGSANIVDAATAGVIATLNFDTTVRPSWSADGRSLAYARADGQGGDDVVVFATVAQSESVLVPNLSDLHALAWSPDNAILALAAGSILEQVSVRDGSSWLNVYGWNWTNLEWTASGRIIADDRYGDGAYTDPLSWFCTGEVPLAPGANHISASAIDDAGLRSIASAAIEIDIPTDNLPDLAVAASDILFLPPSGKIGQSYSALVTLHNLGAISVDQPTLSATLVAPDGSQQYLPPTSAPSALAGGGGVESVTYALGTLSLPGSYRLSVIADPDNLLREISESNNSAVSSLTLSADGKPVLELNLARSLFAPGDTVTGEVAVTNPGASFDGHVHVSVLDTSNALVANLGDMPIAALAFGQRWSAPVTWNAQGVFAGDYHVRAQLFGADGSSIADQSRAFAIAAVRHVQLALTPDATSQSIGHAVGLHSAVNFSDGNALLSGATLRLTALDPNGADVWHTQQTLGTLLPGYVLGRDDVWPTTGLAQGLYTLRLSMISPDLTLSTDATVTLMSLVPTVALTGSLVFDPGTTVIAGGDTVLHYNVGNQGGGALSGVQARLRIVSGPQQTPVSEQDDQFDLAVGATHAASLTLTAPPLVLISHAAILEAHLASDAPGQWRLLAQQGFAVVDLLPPVIGVLSPPTNVVQPAVVPFRAWIVDQHSAVASAQVSVDGGNWQPVSAGADGYYARGLTGLIDGAHTLSVRASDTWGNQAQTAAQTFTVDATPPVIVIAGVADGDVVNHAVTPTVTIADAHLATSDVRMSGNPFTSGTLVDQDGSYVLTARATDVATNSSVASVRFVVDRTAPAVTIASPLDGATVDVSSIHVDVQTEAGAQVALATGNYNAPGTADAQGHAGFDDVPLALGANQITATAADAAGNVSSPASITVTYQQVAIAPLTGTLQPDANELDYGTPLGVNVLVQNPNVLALSGQQLRVRVLDAAQNALSTQTITHDFGAGENYSTNLSFASTSWPLGALTLKLELDEAGTWIALDTKQITVVDRTPPLLALTAPAEGAVLHGPLTVTATASDALTGVASVEQRIDGGDWTAMNASGGDAYASAVLALPDGDHQVELQAHDGAGNLASVSVVHFAIDSVPPLINIAGVADGDLIAHAVSPGITISDAHLSTSDVRLNGQPYVSGTAIGTSGGYRIDVSAADSADNQSSASVSFTLDLDPPTVVFMAPAPNATVVTASIEVTGQTEPLASVHLATGGFSVDTVADASGVFDVMDVPLQAGANTLTAHATDKAGNVGPDATLTVTYQTVGLTGIIGPLVVQIPRGLPLDIPYTLHNTGNVAFAALPLRIELHPAAGGDAIVSDDFATDIDGGADEAGTRHLDTAALQPGGYTAVLLANMPASPGPGGWITLDSATTLVFVDPCRRAGSDAIFANGFETGAASFGDVIFCNGFEQLLSRPGMAKMLARSASHVVTAFWQATADAIPAIRVVGAAIGSELANVPALYPPARDVSVTGKAWHLPYSRALRMREPDDDPHRFGIPGGVAAIWAPEQAVRELR